MGELELITVCVVLLFVTPLLLLMWFGGHRYNLKRLAVGEPVIHIPSRDEHGIVLGRGGAIIPRRAPMMYIGATASAGTLRLWSVHMLIFCFAAFCATWLPAVQWTTGAFCIGLMFGMWCLMLTPLYLADIPLVAALAATIAVSFPTVLADIANHLVYLLPLRSFGNSGADVLLALDIEHLAFHLEVVLESVPI